MHYQRNPRFWGFAGVLFLLLLVQLFFYHTRAMALYWNYSVPVRDFYKPKPMALTVFHHLAGFYNLITAWPANKKSPLYT